MRGKNIIKLIRAIDLLGKHNGVTIAELSEKLGKDRRSVYRLIDTIEELGIPIYDEKTLEREKRWKIEENYLKKLPNLNIPDINLTLSEIISLYLVRSHVRLFKGTDIEKKLNSAFAKIDRFVPEGLYEKLDRIKTLFVPISKFAKDYSGKQEIIDRLTEAMLHQKACLVKYHSFLHDRISEFKIDPLYFFEYNGGLYIFVRAVSYEDILTFAIERFREVTVTDKTFEYPGDFNPEERLGYAFGITANDPIEAKIRFSADQARYIKERKWAQNQKIITQKDGSIIIELKTSGRWDVKRWVMSYGADAEVLEPEDLRMEVAAELKAAGKNYK